MEFILTESQVLYLKEEAMAQVLQESLLMEVTSFKQLVNKVKAALVAGVTASVLLIAINKLQIPQSQKIVLTNMVQQEQLYNNKVQEEPQEEPQAKETPIEDNSDFQEKVDAVQQYMEYAAKNQKFNPEHIQLSPEYIVKICNSENFDLPLLLAQAHLESCFGLTNRARKTNSVFSVGSYDNGKNVCVYPDQNSSVKSYINLMKNDYLKNKSIDQMLKPGQMVNPLNKRYASDKSYEGKLKNVRNRIIRMFPELT